MQKRSLLDLLPSPVVIVGNKILETCDAIGERCAHFLGITSPKYQREIDEHNRLIREEEALTAEEKAAYAGWGTVTTGDE